MKVERFAVGELAGSGLGSAGPVAVAEIRALACVDEVVAPELIGMGGSAVVAGVPELRLGQPPLRSESGEVLFRALGGFVEKFAARERVASREERRMGALLRGIHGLEVQIRAQIAQSARI